MSTQSIATSEYNSYYQRYIDQAMGLELTEGLEHGLKATTGFFNAIPLEKHEYRYEEGKWTPKQILLHIIDTERVFTYRALQFARSANAVIKGFDQDEFADNADTTSRTIEELLAEFDSVRRSTILFAKSCTQETMQRMGEASGSPLSVRAALSIIVGHEKHHCKVIDERYL